MITTACLACGKVFNLSDEKAGKRGKCTCGAVLQIPALVQTKAKMASASIDPIRSARTSVPQNASGVDQSPFHQRQQPSAPSKPTGTNTSRRLIAIVASAILILGGILVFKIVSDHTVAQSLQKAEADRISEQAKADLAQAEKLRAEADALREQQVKRDLEAKEIETKAKEQAAIAAQNDPAKLFEKFSGVFMQEVTKQITATSYIAKVDVKYNINATRTSSLLAPIQGVIDGGVLTRLHGQLDAASTPVRLTFALKDDSWVLGAMETKDVVVGDGPYGREVHVGPWGLCVNLNGFEGFFTKATDRANEAMKK